MTVTSPLGRLIAPCTVETFFAEYWEKKPLRIEAREPSRFREVISSGDIDRVVTSLGLHHPEMSLVDNTKTLDPGEYTFPSGMIDVARFYRLFADGATMILPNLERRHYPLAALCRSLESEFSTRFQSNIYMTPKAAQGFRPHYDTHDVFVLQIEGVKQWLIYDTPVELPFRGQDFNPKVNTPGPVSLEFDLCPGDVLYIPRGVMHDARTRDTASLHVTLGAMFTSWTELLVEALGAVGLSDPSFRASLPVGFAREGFDRGSSRETFRSLLQRLSEGASFDRALDHFADDLISTRHPLLSGQMGELENLSTLGEDSRVGARESLLFRVIEKGDVVILSCQGSELRLPSGVLDSLRFALTHGDFRVREMPGALDLAGKLVLVRRLVREGLLRFV